MSTDISTDKKMKRLSDFAALLYTWMIPHAGDDCRITGAKDPEEIKLLVVPNRPQNEIEVAAALDELFAEGLIGQDDDGRYFFPAVSFYKYQTRIPKEKRVDTPQAGYRNSPAPFPGENAEERRSAVKTPENAVLPSPIPLPSPSLFGGSGEPPSRARAELIIDNDLGLGDRHPAVLCGWDMWRRLEKFWRTEGRRLGIFQIELIYKQLSELKEKGQDPVKIVEKTCRSGWLHIRPLDVDEVDIPLMNIDDIRKKAKAGTMAARPRPKAGAP